MSDQQPDEPFRPDVWGDRPETRRLRPGGPLDPAGDPDRYRPEQDRPAADDRPDTGAGRPLDLSRDPDRFRPDDVPPVVAPVAPVPRRLDPARDPDRYGGPGDRTLVDLLGEGAQEERRDTYVWLAGLLSVLAFLGLVAYLSRFLGP